jgi:hypothetical protein
MAPAATLTIERIEAPELQRVETVARLAYRFYYHGDADLHLTGQPCDVLAGANKSAAPGSCVVVFACGCREVVPAWTLRLRPAGGSVGV